MFSWISDYLDAATPAERLILGIYLTGSYLAAYYIMPGFALFVDGADAYLNMPLVYFYMGLVTFTLAVEIGMLLWLLPRRRSPEPLPRLFMFFSVLVVIPYTFGTLLSGPYTFPINLVIVGLVPVGFLLMGIRPTLIAASVGLCLLVMFDSLTVVGLIPYAPLFKPSVMFDPDAQALFKVSRTLFLYIHAISYGCVIYAIFAQYDNQEVKLTTLAHQDPLTGLANRRYFFERLESETRNQDRTGEPLSVVMLDADHFKRINDNYGHLVGDQVLIEMSKMMTALVRVPSDVPARLGGEEFALLLPNTDLVGAIALCERLKSELAQHDFTAGDGAFHATLSMGVSTSVDSSVQELLKNADQNLYRAKEAGRNKIVGSELQRNIPVKSGMGVLS